MTFSASAALFIIILFMNFFFNAPSPTIVEMELLALPINSISVSFLFDSMSLKFISTVLLISTSVAAYSHSYMDDENNQLRFMLLVIIFIFSMLLLITSCSIPLLFLSWDGLGLSSYFLIVHYQSMKPSGSGLTTVISNRIGDIFIILTGIITLSEVSSWVFLNTTMSFSMSFLLSLAVLSAAITKSAMFPYCTWLPEAMAAPTPVSSLVHSSTLVTAGVYLIIRTSPCFHPTIMWTLTVISSFTLLLSSGSAVFCLDFKKVIALSTLSQLSFMFVTLAIGAPMVAFFHLITHALFKSSLFMAAGSFIHLTSANQDMRLMAISKSAPSSTALIAIPIFALSGLPFMAGYFSKEMILIISVSSSLSLFTSMTMVLGAFLTFLYSMRMLYSLLLMHSCTTLPKDSLMMDLSKYFLLVFSMIGGYLYATNTQPFYSHSAFISTFVSALTLSSLILWTTQTLVFNPQLALHWNNFVYLAQTTKTLLPLFQIYNSSFVSKFWETGWQESLGPKFAYHTLTKTTNWLYSLSTSLFYSIFTCVMFILFLPLFAL